MTAVDQTSSAPTRKLKASMATVAPAISLATVFVWLAEEAGYVLPSHVSAALASLVVWAMTTASAYITRDEVPESAE